MTRAATADQDQRSSETEHIDVLIVGAGVSGIGAAHRMRTQFPGRSFTILEAQEDRGGTWWTHQYPGARSDSDLFTYGYRHKPWRGASIAAGGEILSYLDEVISEWHHEKAQRALDDAAAERAQASGGQRPALSH